MFISTLLPFSISFCFGHYECLSILYSLKSKKLFNIPYTSYLLFPDVADLRCAFIPPRCVMISLNVLNKTTRFCVNRLVLNIVTVKGYHGSVTKKSTHNTLEQTLQEISRKTEYPFHLNQDILMRLTLVWIFQMLWR